VVGIERKSFLTKLQVAIVGYGGMGSFHAKLIEENPNVTVCGTFDILDTRQKVAQIDGYRVFESLEDILFDNEVDVVLVATPNDSHKDLSIKALQSGKHVICEKPVTLNTSEYSEVLEVAKKVNRVFMVHQNRRWDEDFLMIKKLYTDRKVGDVFQIESRVQGANGIPGDWRHMKEFGGGMLLDWGVHLLDQILNLVNSPLKSVAADLSYVLGNGVDDGFMSHLTFENGVKAIVEVGTTNFVKLPRWYVRGTDGSVVIHDWGEKAQIVKRSNVEDIEKPKPIQAGAGLTKTMAPPSELAIIKETFNETETMEDSFYTNFYKVVTEQAIPIVKNEEVFRVMKVIEAIFEAAETESIIHLDKYSKAVSI